MNRDGKNRGPAVRPISPAFVFSLIVALLVPAGVFAQQTPAPVREDVRVGWPAAIYGGTCADPAATPSWDLGELTNRLDDNLDGLGAETTELRGHPSAIPVATGGAEIETTFDEVFDSGAGYVLIVGAGIDDVGTAVACGEIAGTEDDGRVVVGLRPVGGNPYAGIAILDEDEDEILGIGDDEIDVKVYLMRLEPATAPGATQPESGAAQASEYAHPEWLVDGEWLDDRVNDPALYPDGQFVIIGVWPRDEAADAVVPATVRYDWDQFALTETSNEAIALWRGEIERLLLPLGGVVDDEGLSPSDLVVLYDDGSLQATGVWWALDYLGHENKRLLEGGVEAWEAAGGVASAPPATGPVGGPVLPEDLEPYPGGPNAAVLATLEYVRSGLADESIVLVDTRSAEDYAAGHIPGAVNVPWGFNNGAGGRWRDAATLADLYAEAGVTPDKRVVTYGDASVGAQVSYFTLRLLGYEDVAVYPGGWVEWSRFPDLPRETGNES